MTDANVIAAQHLLQGLPLAAQPCTESLIRKRRNGWKNNEAHHGSLADGASIALPCNRSEHSEMNLRTAARLRHRAIEEHQRLVPDQGVHFLAGHRIVERRQATGSGQHPVMWFDHDAGK